MTGKTILRFAPAAALFAAVTLAAPQSAFAAEEPPPVYPGCNDFGVIISVTGGNQTERLFRTKDGVEYTIVGGHGTLLTVTNAEDPTSP